MGCVSKNFRIHPTTFELRPNETVIIEVIFMPWHAAEYEDNFVIVCDNCQIRHIKITGKSNH